jgi:hypothetical protein
MPLNRDNCLEPVRAIGGAIFNYLLIRMSSMGIDSDRRGFREIRKNLDREVRFSPEEFVFECFYVVCVAGFKQDRAKIMCDRIIDFILKNPNFTESDLKDIYHNRLKTRAIWNIWSNRYEYQRKFYSLSTPEEKVNFLQTLPNIGPITKYHIARNLGLNFVKYDIWIQRLGTALSGNKEYVDKVSNVKLLPEIKVCCDRMINELHEETGEKIGFIDVVLWRACQKGLIKIKNSQVFIDKSL